jgi:hypothetical protein
MLAAAFVFGVVLALVWVCVRREYDGVWLVGAFATVVVIVAACLGFFDREVRR